MNSFTVTFKRGEWSYTKTVYGIDRKDAVKRAQLILPPGTKITSIKDSQKPL